MSELLTAQEIIYSGAGAPPVRGPDGEPLREANLGECGYCGRPAVYRLKECVSANFMTIKRMRLGSAGLCRACAFCARDLRLRCAPWIATPARVDFCFDRRQMFEFLTAPPEPPFAAGVPWMGIKKGGLTNWRYARVWDPTKETQELSPAKLDERGVEIRAPQVMTRLQSKPTAIFASTAVDRIRYPLAIDDDKLVCVDVPLWRRLGAQIAEAIKYLPVPCLEEWRPPSGGDQWRHGIIHWTELTRPLEPYRNAAWWPLLLMIAPRLERPDVSAPIPEPTPKPRAVAATPQLALF